MPRMMPPMAVTYRAFRQLNDPDRARLAKLRKRLDPRVVEALVPPRDPPTLIDRVVGELAERRALPVKELFESFEFFERVRRRVRAPVVADLCCGHGLTGLLFVVFCRGVDRVVLLDRRRTESFDNVHAAVLAAAPWVEGRVDYLELPLSRAKDHLPPGAALVGVHACGARTDRCIDLAIERRATLAVMPCCYHRTASRAPAALRRALGARLATDVDRTYRLRAAGFEVEWSEVPATITEMNRILIATPA